MNQPYSRSLLTLLLLVFGGWLDAYAQTNPVQVTTQLIPPYSVYLQDYVSGESERLRVVLTLRDLTANVSDITLRLRIRKDGRSIIQTTPTYNPVPIFLNPGAPAFISGVDLRGYFRNENLDFLGGYSREEYLTNKAMPEGFYEICFTAYDARRPDVRLSEEGCAIAFLSKNEPPLLNFPACGTNQPSRSPQQIIFSWVPQSFGNPSLAGQLEYEFTLFEVRPPGRNINDVVLSGLPIYTARTNFAQLVYGVAEPILLAGMEYAWRVQAIDPSGRNSFRNGGYSEVCSFRYAGDETDATMGIVQNFNVRAVKHNRAHANWLLEPEKFKEGYRIFWQRIGDNGEKSSDWYPVEINDPRKDSVDWYDLRPETRYLARIQGKSEGIYGPLSEPVEFVTPEEEIFECSDTPPKTYEILDVLPDPFIGAHAGMYIDLEGMRTRLTEVTALGLAGWYRGRCYIQVPWLGNAWYEATFEEIFIDHLMQVQRGEVIFVSEPWDEIGKEKEERQGEKDRERQQEANRTNWEAITFHPNIMWFEEEEIEAIFWDEAEETLLIVTTNGDTLPDTQVPTIRTDNPEEAVIIEDKNGDQWVVDKDNKIHKVEGGGLSPKETISNSNPLNLLASASYEEAILLRKLSIVQRQIQAYLNGDEDDGDGPYPRFFIALPECLEGLNRSELEEISKRIDLYTRGLENLQALKSLINQRESSAALLNELASKLQKAWEKNENEEKAWKSLKLSDWQAVERMLCPYLQPVRGGDYEGISIGEAYEAIAETNAEEKVVYFTPAGNIIHLPQRAIPYFGSKFPEIHPLALTKFNLDGKWYLGKYDWQENYFLGYNYKYNVLGVSLETIYEEAIDFWEELFPQPKESVQIMASVPSISFIAPEISPPATTATAGRLLSMRLLNLSLVGALTGLQGDTRQKGNTGEGSIPSKEEFEKILFKAAFELGMPDPNQNPEETLDWLLKKQKERRLTIQEQALLEQLMNLLGRNNTNPLLISGQLVSGSSVPDFEKLIRFSEWGVGYSGIMRSDGAFVVQVTVQTKGGKIKRLKEVSDVIGEEVYPRQASHENLARRIFGIPEKYTNKDIKNLYGFSINLGANNTIEVGFSSGSINYGASSAGGGRGITKSNVGRSNRLSGILKNTYQDFIIENLKVYFSNTKYKTYELVKKPKDADGKIYH